MDTMRGCSGRVIASPLGARCLPGRLPARLLVAQASQKHYQQKQQHKQQQQQLPEEKESPLLLLPHTLRALCAPALLATALALGGPASASEVFDLPYYKPEVTTDSSKRASSMVKTLNAAGAKMYGAFWCSHCFQQKQAFGKEAEKTWQGYVECYPDGWHQGSPIAKACADASVRAFPSWVINDRLVEGELSLDELEAELSSAPGEPSPTMVAYQAAQATRAAQATLAAEQATLAAEQATQAAAEAASQ
ncbi:hypothetical protein FOA52_007252 [Chlamydomonas sp. UWO 241]|nr:hypothetical protein FOA52_007252 [Chlamydomonas sp. UWO 241]